MLRVGIISDFAEEGWPSMDLVAGMLLRELGGRDGSKVQAEQLRPAYRRVLPVPSLHNAERLLNRQWVYPRHLRKRRSDCAVFHVLDHSYAHLVHVLPARRTVVTCHDLDAFRSVLDAGRERRGPLFRAMSTRILAGLKKATLVACDTAAIRDELLSHDILPGDRAVVVPLGVAPEFDSRPDARADEALRALIGPSDPAVPELLHVGSTSPRKRIDLLLHIFAQVRQRVPVRLLRAGGPLTAAQRALADQLGVTDAIVTLPYLERSVLAAAYRRAALVLLPSEAEGFGLPPIEALACGTPVLASELPVLREVGAPAVSFAPVEDIAGWVQLTCDLLTERDTDSAGHARRIAAGIAHAGRYSWSAYARQMERLYAEIAAAA